MKAHVHYEVHMWRYSLVCNMLYVCSLFNAPEREYAELKIKPSKYSYRAWERVGDGIIFYFAMLNKHERSSLS